MNSNNEHKADTNNATKVTSRYDGHRPYELRVDGNYLTFRNNLSRKITEISNSNLPLAELFEDIIQGKKTEYNTLATCEASEIIIEPYIVRLYEKDMDRAIAKHRATLLERKTRAESPDGSTNEQGGIRTRRTAASKKQAEQPAQTQAEEDATNATEQETATISDEEVIKDIEEMIRNHEMKKKVQARKEVELKAKMELQEKKRINHKANMKIIAQTILKMLHKKILEDFKLNSTFDDVYEAGLLKTEGWKNDPIKLLENIRKITQGGSSVESISKESTTRQKMEAKAAFDRAQQRDKQPLADYNLYFDDLLNDVQEAYGKDVEQALPKDEIVYRYLMSLKDKSILADLEKEILFKHTSMPENYESAKLFAAQATITAGRISKAAHELAFQTQGRSVRKHCSHCNINGHTAEECRKLKNARKAQSGGKAETKAEAETKQEAEKKPEKKATKVKTEEKVNAMTDATPVNNHDEFNFMVKEQCNSQRRGMSLLLDNCSTLHVYVDLELVRNLRKADEVLTMTTKAGRKNLYKVGDCIITGETVYVDDSIDAAEGNILSFAKMSDKYNIEWNQEAQTFTMHLRANKRLVFGRFGRYYKYDINMKQVNAIRTEVLPDYPASGKVTSDILNREDLKKAKRAARLLRNSNNSVDQMKVILSTQAWKGAEDLDAKDVDNAIMVFGQDPRWIKGRAQLKHNTQLSIPTDPTETFVALYFDLMEIFGRHYFVAVTEAKGNTTSIVFAKELENDHALTVLQTLKRLSDLMRTRRYYISFVWSDSQKGITREALQSIGLMGEQTPSKTKVGEIEVVIRLIKERIRSLCAGLVFIIPFLWLKYLVTAAVIQLNTVPKRCADGVFRTARECFYGVKPDMADIEILRFGQLVEVTEANKKNDIVTRSKAAIALYPCLDGNGTWEFYCIDTKTKIKSRSFSKPLAIETNIIEAIKAIAQGPQGDREAVVPEAVHQLNYIAVDPDVTLDDVEHVAECYHVMYGRAVKDFGAEAVEQCSKKEIWSIMDAGTWKPVDFRTNIADASSFMFYKEKVDKLTGERKSIKGRHVVSKAMNNEAAKERQAEIYEIAETRAPTPAWSAICVILGEVATKNLFSKVMDVPSAFIWASNPYNHVILLDERVTAWAVEHEPSWQKHTHNGKLKVQLVKNQYGTAEAANLWHKLLIEFLVKDHNFVQNTMEKCVLSKTVGDDKVSIIVYVDDLKVVATKGELIDEVEALMKTRFGAGLSVSDEGEYDYLGVHVSHNRDTRMVEVTCDAYVTKLLDDFSEKEIKHYKSPASSDLFELNAASELLKSEKKKKYHSFVAKLLWIAMRVRLDILVAIAYLATKVHCPTEHEYGKLKRVIGYLYHKPRLKLLLNGDDLFQNGTINVWVDSSHATHMPSRKSHIGVYASAGKGPIAVKSLGGKRIANSSTASELYALSYSIGVICGLLNFARAYGAEVRRVIVYEDNQAVISLVEKDKPMTDGSKHMEVQRLFVKEHIDGEKIKIQYCRTEDMIADVLTKALTGAQFEKLIVLMGNEENDSKMSKIN